MHHPYLATKQEIGSLVRAIDAFPDALVSSALRFMLLTAARASEVSRAQWAHVDLENALWHIPSSVRPRDRTVNLSNEAIAELHYAASRQASTTHVFGEVACSSVKFDPLVRSMRSAIIRMGFHDRQTLPGLRTLFRHAAYVHLGLKMDVIDVCMGRPSFDLVRRWISYDNLLSDRDRAMQAWGSFIGDLRRGGDQGPTQS